MKYTATLKNLFRPAPHRERLPDQEIRRLYPKYRWSILESTFIGYAMFYLTRNNLSVVASKMESALHYNHGMIGDFLAATAVCYGIGKFLMGSLSDRSNPRIFMPFGLLLTALVNFIFGSMQSYPVHLALWSLNGLIQGMGWPPCGRSLGHWYSVNERGKIFSIWNIAHNVGGGLAGIIAAYSVTYFQSLWGWSAAFYVPGIICLAGAAYLLFRLRDTPQSMGLPPVEEYRNDYPDNASVSHEKELNTRELFVENILKNGYLWLFAAANFFVYIVRYSMLDWGPLYLSEAKGATLTGGGIAVMVLEFGGIPSTILMGWISDKLGGRRGLVSLLCMLPIVPAFIGLWLNPPGNLWLDMTLLCVVGFFVYPPVMLLGVSALDLTSKKAVGTAAGFVGLFGYIGRTVQAAVLGRLSVLYSWDQVIMAILAATGMAIVLLSFTWKIRPRA